MSEDDERKRRRSVVDVLTTWKEEIKERRQSSQVSLPEYQQTFIISNGTGSSSLIAQDTNESDIKFLGASHNHRETASMRVKRDDHDMSRVTAYAGINIFGCVFLEVWVLNKERTGLVRKGAWMDPVFRVSLPDEDIITEAEYLINEAPDTAIGVGLAGTIFGEKSSQRVVQWRQIKSIMTDPFKQRDPNDRTAKIFSLGIGLVGSTTFSFGTDSGIVLFYTRSTRGTDKKSADNERVMLEFTDFIGSTFAMIETRKQCQQMRRQMLSDAVYKVRTALIKRRNKNVDMLGSAILNKDKMAELKAIHWL